MGLELLTFLGLVLVVEGVLYAVAPGAYRRAAAALAQMREERLRLVGLVLAILGAGLLAWLAGGEAETLGFGEIRRFLALRSGP